MITLRTRGLKLKAALHAKREEGKLTLLLNPKGKPMIVVGESTDWFIGRLTNGQMVAGSRTIDEMANYLMSFNKSQLINGILGLANDYLELHLEYDSTAAIQKKYRKLPESSTTATGIQRPSTTRQVN